MPCVGGGFSYAEVFQFKLTEISFLGPHCGKCEKDIFDLYFSLGLLHPPAPGMETKTNIDDNEPYLNLELQKFSLKVIDLPLFFEGKTFSNPCF